MLEFFRGKSGGLVSIFLVAILVPLMTFGTALAELARMNSAGQILTEATDIAAYSMLSDYDRQLLKRFGILAMVVANKAEKNKEFASYLKENLGGSQDSFINTILTLDDTDIELLYSLNQEEVFQKQLDEIVKLRTPINTALNGLDMLNLTKMLDKILGDAKDYLNAASDSLEAASEFFTMLKKIDRARGAEKKLKNAIKEADRKLEEIQVEKDTIDILYPQYQKLKEKWDKKFEFTPPSCEDANIDDEVTKDVIRQLQGMPGFSALAGHLRMKDATGQYGEVPGNGAKHQDGQGNNDMYIRWGEEHTGIWNHFLGRMENNGMDWQSYYGAEEHRVQWSAYWAYYAGKYEEAEKEYNNLYKKMQDKIENINQCKQRMQNKVSDYINQVEQADGKGLRILLKEYESKFQEMETALEAFQKAAMDTAGGIADVYIDKELPLQKLPEAKENESEAEKAKREKETKKIKEENKEIKEERKLVKDASETGIKKAKDAIEDLQKEVAKTDKSEFDEAEKEIIQAQESANALSGWIGGIGEISEANIADFCFTLPAKFLPDILKMDKGNLHAVINDSVGFWDVWEMIRQQIMEVFEEIWETMTNMLKLVYYITNDRVVYDMRYQVKVKGNFTQWAEDTGSAKQTEDEDRVHDFLYSQAGDVAADELHYEREFMDAKAAKNEMSQLEVLLQELKGDFSSFCDAVEGFSEDGFMAKVKAMIDVAKTGIELVQDIGKLIAALFARLLQGITNSAKLASYGVDMFSNRTTVMNKSSTTLLGEKMNNIKRGKEAAVLASPSAVNFLSGSVAGEAIASLKNCFNGDTTDTQANEDFCFAMAEAEYILMGQDSEKLNQIYTSLILLVERIPFNLPAAAGSELTQTFASFYGVGYAIGFLLVLVLETLVDFFLLTKGVSVPLLKVGKNIFISAKGLEKLISSIEEAAKNVAASFDLKNEMKVALDIAKDVGDDMNKESENEKKDKQKEDTGEKGGKVSSYLQDTLELDYKDHLWIALMFLPNSWKLERIRNLMEMEMRVQKDDENYSLAHAYTYIRAEANAKWSSLLPLPQSVFGEKVGILNKKVVLYRGY